jgi:hypothetical protein
MLEQKHDEQRQTPRFRIDRPGTVVLGNGRSVDCTVLDLGSVGARLGIRDGAAMLPKRFELQLGDGEASARVRLLWQHGDFAGVVFDAEPKPTGFWALLDGMRRGGRFS